MRKHFELNRVMWQIVFIGIAGIAFASGKMCETQGVAMENSGQQAAIELGRMVEPLLILQSPDAETPMGETVGEGLKLPSADVILQKAVPRETVLPLHHETLEWIHWVIKPQWVVQDVADRLHAVRQAVNKEDAFIGAWMNQNRIFQVVVTRERLHLITQMPHPKQAASLEEQAQQCLALANGLLELPGKPDPAAWEVRPFGGLVMGYQDGPPARDWHQTLLFVTDGSSVKFSILKYRHRSGPPQKGSAERKHYPWFPGKETIE